MTIPTTFEELAALVRKLFSSLRSRMSALETTVNGIIAGGVVSTAFGRSGTVTAQANDYTFAQLASKPTTLVGYGITDGLTEISGLQALGSEIKTSTVGFSVGGVTGHVGLTDGILTLVAVYLPTAQTITGVKWLQGAQGNYTADNYNGVGLYSYSAGTLTLVASCANDGNIWKATANAIASKAFSSQYPAAAGLYYIGFLYNNSAEVANPTIGSNSGVGAISALDLTNSAKLFAILNSQTALPTPFAMSTTTATVTRRYFMLY
jgi:hypothetical protein